MFDIKDHLFQGIILREKDFREFIKTHDWAAYQDKNVAVTCTVDAIVPRWAYMLIMQAMQPYANYVVFGDLQTLDTILYQQAIARLVPADFQDQRVIIKGCSDMEVPPSAYLEVTRVLTPVAKSIMYGEPCSTVPVYKKK